MLVCNVSLARRRAAIAAGIVEVAAALDAPGTGNVVFATLVDDPASVGDIIDAYLGEIMVEAASANAIVDASIPAILVADITEAATATEIATVVAAPTRSAMIPGAFVNPSSPRQANVAGTMVNL